MKGRVVNLLSLYGILLVHSSIFVAVAQYGESAY